jgi:hypothetical protein
MSENDPQSNWKKFAQRPSPPQPGSSEGVEFKDWDWKKHDKEFYE